MINKYLIFHILLVISIAFIVLNAFHYLNSFNRNISIDSLAFNRPSSVWCNGQNQSERRCRFVNLCYKKDTSDYIFFIDNKLSVISGIPSDRFSPALLDLSSVSDHNQFYFNYVEIPFKVLQNLSKIYKLETIKGKTLILSRFKPDNLMHLLHDDIIPLYFALDEIGSKQINHLFLDDMWPQVFDSTLQFSQYIYSSLFPRVLSKNEMSDNIIYCFEEAFVGVSKSMTWYQYGFRVPQSPISRTSYEQLLISNTIRRLTNAIIPLMKCSTYYFLLLSRKITRKILNEEQLIALISQITGLPVITLMIEEFGHNFEELIKKVYCAKLMIGMHGSGLILSMFLQSGSSLIELFPFAINSEHFTPYKTLTQLNGMNINYFEWKNQIINNTVTHSEYPKELGGIQHLSDEEKENISSRVDDVPKHLCCSNTYWLYRIYQDTIIDIDSIKPIIETAFNRSLHYKTPLTKRFASSHVIDSYCSRILRNNIIQIRVVWEKPWNLDYIIESDAIIRYEVLIQEVPSISAKSSVTEDKEYVFAAKPDKSYNIWIRCRVNDISGPFLTNPLIC